MSALPLALRLTYYCWCLFTYIVILLKGNCAETHDTFISADRNLLARQKSYGDLDREGAQSGAPRRTSDGLYDEETDGKLLQERDGEYDGSNSTENGQYLGSSCDNACSPNLQHVVCDKNTGTCTCEESYPVRIGPEKGCAKAKKLGEQCFYLASCTFTDQHATCTQVLHNAVCDCNVGYHRVVLSRPTKKVFCAEDLVLIKTDLVTLLGVASGIAVLTGLICLVLKLFSKAMYSSPRHYADACQDPAMLYSNDAGIPGTLSGRPSSRTSQYTSDGTLSCGTFTRQPSTRGGHGSLAPASRAGAARAAAILLISCHLEGVDKRRTHRRSHSDVAEGSNGLAGSRRPSLASIHSTTSSAKSYSARRLEKERNDKMQRLALQELRLTRQKEQELQQQLQCQPAPSPRTPHSTDGLLPAVEESREEILTVIASELLPGSQIPQTSSSSNERSSLTVSVASTSLIVHSSMNTDETAFTTPMCTSAFDKAAAAYTNVVDIFDS